MRAFLVTCLLGLVACGGGGGSATSAPPPPPPPPVATGDITLLFMGNSHTAFHDVPGTVATLVRGARPGRTVVAQQAPGGMFLEERATDSANLALLDGQRWTFVVLQAQKYSTSGLFSYPIDGAVELARRAREGGAVPVMFPEWPRRGIDETQRIFELHVSIAQRVPACVAPIGQAWDRALAQYPGLVLHDSDGNHSAAAGAFLAAVVIAATMTGAQPDTLPFVPAAGVDAELQARLRTVATETIALNPSRQYCPADPFPQ